MKQATHTVKIYNKPFVTRRGANASCVCKVRLTRTQIIVVEKGEAVSQGNDSVRMGDKPRAYRYSRKTGLRIPSDCLYWTGADMDTLKEINHE